MDDQESGLIPKKLDSDRSNAFHMLPHTIEDICTQQSMSTNANTDLYFSPIRHVLPQIPTRSSTLRMAISKQTHREMFASALGNKQDTSSGIGHQIDLSGRERSTATNSDESQDQLPLDVRELIPSWKESQQSENSIQNIERDSDLSFQHRRQDQQESSVDSNIAPSGFHSSSSSASSASNIDPYLMNPEHRHLEQHLPPFSPANKDGEPTGKGHPSEFMQTISGIGMASRLDRNSPQMSSSLSNFNNQQQSWQRFDFGKGYNNQSNEVVALEQVVQKVNNPLNVVLQSSHQVLPSTRSFESSPNPIKLKIRRDISAMEQQQQLQHNPHPLQQPPQITPPPSHMSHNRMMLSNHQMPMDFQLHQQQKHLQQQQHPYMYESPRYVQSQGPKDYYHGGGNSSENVNSSSSSKVANMHFSSEYQDSSSRHMNPYSPDQPLSSMSVFPPGQLQHAHHYHNQQQQQIMNQQLQHQSQYQCYQHHVAPQTTSNLPHRSSTPLSSAMMVLHGAAPSPPIFNCPSQPPQPVPSPSSAALRPKTGRAKTNAELKKQLMEKRAGQQVRASGDGSSLASSPSPSQIEVSSPRSVSSPHSESSFGGGAGFQEAPMMNSNGMEGQQQFIQPNLGQYVELTKEEMQKSNLLWQIGDLVWAQVTGHPWWPAMIIPDPVNKEFVKLAPRGQRSQYHMQFFGEERERSWVIDSSAIQFEGKAAFQDFCQKRLLDTKKDRKAYKVPSQHKKSWEASVRSAERAFGMSRLEKFARLSTLFLPEYKTKRSGRKSSEETNKRKVRSDRSNSCDKFAKRSRIESDQTLVGGNAKDCLTRDAHHHLLSESSHIVLPKNVSNQQQAQFTVFCRKKREVIAQENPLWTTADIDAHLWQQWSQLDDETRSRFIPMGSDFTYLSRMMQNVDVGGAAGDAGIAKPSMTAGKMNGFAGESPCIKIVTSKNTKIEETRGRKKTVTSNVCKGIPSKHDMKSDCNTNQILDEVCFICEKPDLNLVQCTGPCRGLFHRGCIGLNNKHHRQPVKACLPEDSSNPDGPAMSGDKLIDEEEIVCPKCRTKTHNCCECGEILKQTEATTVLCSITDCGRFYHRACIDIKFFKTPDKLICPLHSCLTCRVRNKVKDSDLILADEEDLDFYECIRCPSAFHIPGVCLSTGSKYLAGPFVVCSKHFAPTPKTHPLHARFGATWCFTCEKSGGHMLNCESCPASHHPSCLKISTNPSDLDGWQCPDCIASINPLHGEVVWVKFGSYRWWPAQIYWPYEVPQNIADLPHEVGEFPVCFFGSRDYLWLNRRRVFPFRSGDKCCREALRKSGGKVFDKAIREAIATYKALKSDPTACVSNVKHLDKDVNKIEDEDCDDVIDEDIGGKSKRKRKQQKVTPDKFKQVSRPNKRVRNTREGVRDQMKSDSEKLINPDEDHKEDEPPVPTLENSAVVSNRSPMTFLSPQIEKDLSELRAKLKMKKKPVDSHAFIKKSFPSGLRPSKKVGRERSSKNDSSSLHSGPSSIVSTLINRPLLQTTSLPGVHDSICSWCGFEGQSSSESDDDDVDNKMDATECLKSENKNDGRGFETMKDDNLSSISTTDKDCSKDLIKNEAFDMDRRKLIINVTPCDSQINKNGDNVYHITSEEDKKGVENIKAKYDDDNEHNNSKEKCNDDDGNNPETTKDKETSKVTMKSQTNEDRDDDDKEIITTNHKEDDNNNNLKNEVTSNNIHEDKNNEKVFEEPKVKVEISAVSDTTRNERFRRRGRLIFCDKVKCSKVYHYKCLKLTKMPHGHWLCPLHQCTICGRASTHQCSKCPSAFCLEHFPHCLSYMDDGSPICTGHPEAPSISEELVADIMEEMAVAREAEVGHSAGSLSHRRASKHGEEADDVVRVEAPATKLKKRKRSASTSSSSSHERKKKTAKKIKRKKPAEVKDVSFEKRILPSRTQSREKRFLDNNSDEEVKSDKILATQEKVKDSKEPAVLPLKEQRSHIKEDQSTKKNKKDKKKKLDGSEKIKMSGRKGERNQSLGEKSPMKSTIMISHHEVVNLHKEDLNKSADCPKKIDETTKHESQKLEKFHQLKDKKSKKKEEDESEVVKVKKKRKKSSSGVKPCDADPKHSNREESLQSPAQQTLPPTGAGGKPTSSPARPSLTLATTREVLEPSVTNRFPLVKPSSLIPPPSSPDKSPMFDNSDDEFPELVIDVPM